MNSYSNLTDILEFDKEVLLNILNYSSDEIYILNRNLEIIYVNKMCEQHYGLRQNEIIGKHNDIFLEKGYWTPSIIPIVLEKNNTVTINQTTHTGKELVTTAIPIFNPINKNLDFIFITSREKNYISIIHNSTHELSSSEHLHSNGFITCDDEMTNIIDFSKKIAPVDTNILIQGESGTGKGVLAKYIHDLSNRKNGPFLAINCAAIPEELLESELFGYAAGAFTGALKNGKIGLLETANKGTIFLDEIGEISLKFQAKLLQVLQHRSFFSVGGRELKMADVRIITATNRNLLEMVKSKQFREDLFYRLNVIDIQIPPLRKRKKDIPLLADHFLTKFNHKYKVNRSFSSNVKNAFEVFQWPGNIRQLENIIERLVITSDSVIRLSDLPSQLIPDDQSISIYEENSLDNILEETEKKMIIESYKIHKSSRKVAKDLGLSQTKANKLIRKYCKSED
ncbi:histidine kinase [Bacillus sp. AFS002410]|uniref:sigma-54 interaction domain-containing protein n=1 Tax=Bacillus sp. AFS002410 TaxID=2033481 RepID=UPI000BF01742|nr:sigma 54-interacting transcriptional regulator [Bacillus sp. AFS002410]PEJ60580.1 histidine kinase [Bacillus sp. AFS002410]